MPDAALLRVRPVQLRIELATLLGRKGLRAACNRCGEEVLNGRQVVESGRPVCQVQRRSVLHRRLLRVDIDVFRVTSVDAWRTITTRGTGR